MASGDLNDPLCVVCREPRGARMPTERQPLGQASTRPASHGDPTPLVPNVNRSGKLQHLDARFPIGRFLIAPNVNRSDKLQHAARGRDRACLRRVPNVNRSGKLQHN